MKEFYEPMLFMSSPSHPNTMGVLFVLKEPVDGDILKDVVEELRVRFPYFYVKPVARDNDVTTGSNPLPMTVRNTWNPIHFNGEESNFHLAAWKYEGNRLAFEISHSITDGAGVLPYAKSALYLYLSRKTGMTFDPEGFRLPGSEIPESEVGNPFAGLDVDGAEPPLYTKPSIPDFFRLRDENEHDSLVTYVKLSEAQLMQYCKDYDGSPNAFMAVMFARAMRHLDPASEKTINISIAIDHKAMLGSTGNYCMQAYVVEVDFPKNRPLDDLLKSCTIARGQIMLQAQPENSLWAMKQKKALYAKLDQMPLDMKLGVIAKSAGAARWTAGISYVNNRSFGPLDPYIEQFYVLAESGVEDVGLEIACFNNSFFLAIAQNFSSDAFVRAFLDELSSVGIAYEVMNKELMRLCGLEEYKL